MGVTRPDADVPMTLVVSLYLSLMFMEMAASTLPEILGRAASRLDVGELAE